MTSRTSEVKVAAADGDDEDDDAVKVSSVFRLMCGFISYDLFEGRVITARARGPIADSPDFTRNHSRLISFLLSLASIRKSHTAFSPGRGRTLYMPDIHTSSAPLSSKFIS